jgi:predicted enzyme related to lactoylglutathione lyase
MSQRTSYSQGTPNWVDLQTTDQDAAKSFYGQLFGWTYDDQPMPQGPVYSMASKNGGAVAAIAPQSPELAEQGVPPTWNTYLAVADIDAAAGRVEAAGGKLLMRPFDVMDAGRMCVAADPTGAAVALWQADKHIGATVVSEPGAVIWNELVTDDKEGAVPFYEQVFGLTASTNDMAGTPYTSFAIGSDTVAGTTTPPMEGVPNHWHVYFAVENTVDAAERATALGGTVLNGPFDTPIGPIATLRDPQGGVFSVIAPTSDTERSDTN